VILATTNPAAKEKLASESIKPASEIMIPPLAVEGDPTGIVAGFKYPALQVGAGMLGGFDGGTVVGLSWIYGYADGNPLGIIDPTGGGAKPVWMQIDDFADQWAFLAKYLGMQTPDL
jgi:hypothetical protein